MSEPKTSNLKFACREVAKAVLWQNGAVSTDLVETLGAKFLKIAEEHQDFVRRQRESDEVIERAVRYIAHVHAIPPSGTDTNWFCQTLSILMELAVPNSGLTPEASEFLACVQEGIRESLADLPVPRTSVRIEDSDAKMLTRMQEAGIEHGVASELLDLLERLYHGDPMGEEERRLFYLSAVAAPLTRNARESDH
jgi:hypothetical protein